jgi:hypothetical protein
MLYYKSLFGPRYSFFQVFEGFERFSEGFQRTCHLRLSPEDVVKILFGTWHSFVSKWKSVFGKITPGHQKFLSRRVCNGFQRIFHLGATSQAAIDALFGKWHFYVSIWLHLQIGFWGNHSWPLENAIRDVLEFF